MKLIVGALLAFVGFARFMDGECPEDKQIVCADDVRTAYVPCKKAAETGGSDMAADLNCIKYFNKMRGDCWPCICVIAKADHLDIKGC